MVFGDGGNVACNDTGVVWVSVVLGDVYIMKLSMSPPRGVVIVNGEEDFKPFAVCGSGSEDSVDAKSLRSFVGVDILARREG